MILSFICSSPRNLIHQVMNTGLDELAIVKLNTLDQLSITRVPQKLKEAKTLIQSANFLAFELIFDGYQGAWHTSHYGDVEQKWLLERSEQSMKREHYTLILVW
jgi:transposase